MTGPNRDQQWPIVGWLLCPLATHHGMI